MNSDSPYAKLKQRWLDNRIEMEKQSLKIRQALLQAAPIFKKFNLHSVYLFGSILSKKARKNSDVDLLVTPLSAGQYWQCRNELEDSIGRPVDLYTQSDEPKFLAKIRERGEIIYEIQS